MITAWRSGLNESYGSLAYNRLSFEHTVGLQNFLDAVGISVPDLLGVGLLLTVMLWVIRARIKVDAVFGILLALTFTFVGRLHDYDYVGLLWVLATLWLYTCNKSTSFTIFISLTLLLFFPQRILRVFQIPALNHWREIIVLIFLFMLFRLSLVDRSIPKAAA